MSSRANLKKKNFSINSDNRTNGTSSNFDFKLDLPYNNKFNRVSVLQALVSKSYYMFDTSNNSGMVITETTGSVVEDVTIPVGNYTTSTLATAIAAALVAASVAGGNSYTYTCTYSSLTNKFTIINTSAGPQTYSVVFTNRNMADYLGFPLINAIYNSTVATLISSQPINLQRYSELLIHCNLISNNNNDVLLNLFPSTVPYLEDIVLVVSDPEAVSVELRDNMNSNIHISVTDPNNNSIELNNQDVRLTLLMWQEL